MRWWTSDTEPPPGPGPMFYRILQIKLFPFRQNFRSLHACTAKSKSEYSNSAQLRGKYESDFIYHNDEYETEYHHCARNIELPEKLRVSASESVIETDI